MDLRARVDDADLVRAAQAGDGQAFGVLFDRWSTRVVDVAYRIVRDREVAAEVAQDAFLAAWTGLDRLERAESFGGWVLRIGRNRALNRLERERRSVPVGDEEATEVLDRDAHDDEAGDAAARAEDAALVWAAAAALGPRDASVLDLHLRHGLAPAEIAEELGVTPNTAHQVLFRLRNRLGDAVRASVLRRAGHPASAVLGAAVAAARITPFGADAVKVIGVHAAGCPDCAGRQEARLSPEALFAAVPLLTVAPDVLAAIRAGLADAGVPIGEPPVPSSSSSPSAASPSAPSASPSSSDGPPSRTGALVGAAVGVLVLVVAVLLLLGDDGTDPEEVAADGPTTTTTAPSSVPSPSSTDGSTASTTTSSTTPPGVSSLPAPTAPPTTTTGPQADIGATTEPGLAPNPTTTVPPVRPPRPRRRPPRPRHRPRRSSAASGSPATRAGPAAPTPPSGSPSSGAPPAPPRSASPARAPPPAPCPRRAAPAAVRWGRRPTPSPPPAPAAPPPARRRSPDPHSRSHASCDTYACSLHFLPWTRTR